MITTAERIIARLIDEKRLSGDEAITLIRSLKEPPIRNIILPDKPKTDNTDVNNKYNEYKKLINEYV